ncbi:hypothetical protein GFL09_00285 [Pseudomonas stutzeri]|uniref:hypothetical protein n=1 Tax=Stutzerimonas stutzeri TaxID=316 RepID=UPI00190A36D7|nr:hypothetical protein [Stutzerimonas stutzeri]MBK3866150.1 hypothetical protein [Stutzerimonas stutzeri]
MSGIVYFSKMFQAVPHLAQVAALLPGTFVSNRPSTLSAVRKLYPQLQRARYSRWLGGLAGGNRALGGAEIIVTGSPYRSFLQPYGAKKCTVFHGTYMFLTKNALIHNSHFDLLCVIGPRMQQMIDRFADEVKVKTVTTGFLPFCEFPEQSAAQRESVLLRLGLAPDKRTIIYTPSRRGVGSWDFLAEALVDKVPSCFNLVLRPHPNQTLTARSADRESFRRVIALAKKRPHTLLDLTTHPLSALLSVADLVISDANSPAEESLFYDVPQLLIETPQLSRDVVVKGGREEGMHSDDVAQLLTLYECGPSCFVSEANQDISGFIELALANQSGHAQRRRDYFSWVFGKRDRLANQRVAEAITASFLVR